ncbi:hypothetical protein ACFVW1_11540 [Streptomyces olivochromogenes]|uniref:hypothetical protein n=1 Tax=Streptomyces olivochromogenes TaxID=1963 RepID=UPI0036D806B4
MRKFAIGAAVSGALALSALVVPSASAATPDLTFSNVVVNNGKAIVVGTTSTVKVPITYTLTHPVDLVIDNKTGIAGIALYRGSSLSKMQNEMESDDIPSCTTTSTTATTVTNSCTEVIAIEPQDYFFGASDAGTWKVAGFYGLSTSTTDDSGDHLSFNYGYDMWGGLGTTQIKRAAKLTTDATPEPVKKGKTLTVKGALTRADWETSKYSGYTGQPVALQFKAKGATAYKTVKTVTSGSKGALTTTVKASADGSYRYSFAGTTTTGAATATGDYVDVQ